MKEDSKSMISSRFLKENKWESIGFFLLIFSVLINVFPEGHVILGGDVVQVLNLSENFGHYFSEDWFRQSVLFYGIFYFLDKIGIGDTSQISWYLAIFLLGSYLSFLAFCRIIFPTSSGLVRMICSLFYATNIYTLYIFTATWGYIAYQSLYIFIPALVGLYISALTTKKNTHLILFLFVLFCSSVGYSNPAFALSFGIFFLFLTILLLLSRLVQFDLDNLKRIAVISLGAVLLNLYWILPLMPQLKTGIEEVYNSEFVDLSERLEKTSNAVFDTVRLLPTSEQDRYFPSNFPYVQFSWLKKYFVFLTFIPFFIVLVGWMQKKEILNQKLYVVFFALFVMFVALVARIRFPFDKINAFLFQLPGLNTLRGWDKLATFTPFLLCALTLIFLITAERKRYFRSILGLFFILIILLALPFYAGGIQTKMSYILSGQKAKDFRLAKQSAIVKIPESYFSVAPILRADERNNKVAMLPFSPGSSVGRVNLPEWKVNGPYVVKDLYGKKYVELNGYYIPGWMFAKEFENQIYDPKWIVDLYGLLGVKYIFYHKDAKQSSTKALEDARVYLERIKAFEKINDNHSFYLYSIDDQLVFPYIYSGTNIPSIKMTPENLSESIAKLHEKITPLSYQHKKLKHVVVNTNGIQNASRIFLNESYSPFWKAKHISSNGVETVLEKDEKILYANAWIVKNELKDGSLSIYFFPAELYIYGVWISGASLLLLLFGLLWFTKKNNT